MYKEQSLQEIDQIMQQSWKAFKEYRQLPLQRRAAFMKAIAKELEACGDTLIQVTMRETNLPEARLRGERGRTIFQLNQYADACVSGEWLEARIDTAIPDKAPPKPDIRKMLVPLGPVVVFGASNFPYAYSTAGGDTACAFAAGCPVIVKAHPAHPETSHIVSEAILRAAAKTDMPKGIFAHVYGSSFETGKALVTHRYTKAVGFTGSYAGGKALFDWANQRSEPIPVFAEMGSVNPVFLLPEKLSQDAASIATQYAGSITLGVGQFCTNPGIIIGIDGPELQNFIHDLGKAIQQLPPAAMLHAGIVKAYKEKKGQALLQESVHLVAESATAPLDDQGLPTIATATGAIFLNNPLLHQEVFGPYSIVIRCADANEMLQVAQHLEGQLTATLMATDSDLNTHKDLVDAIQQICGRIIQNGVPTGVEVCWSMHHGGPFPASTDSRFTSVGPDGIKRFARPLSFQNWSDQLLPEPLQDVNSAGIWRIVNGQMTKENVNRV